MQLSHMAHVHIAYFTHASGMKNVFVTRTQCKNAIKPYGSRAYCLFYSCVGYDFVCDGDRVCRATVEFQDRLEMLINCAHEQDGNFHDSWRQNGDAFTRLVR